jgi:hypothetical protein
MIAKSGHLCQPGYFIPIHLADANPENIFGKTSMLDLIFILIYYRINPDDKEKSAR